MRCDSDAIRDERGDPAQEPGSLEQLLAERPGGPVADGHERQPGPGVAGDHPGEQRQVVLDDRRRDRHRRHVDHAQARFAQQQEQEEEPLLVCLRQAAAAVAERSSVTDGMTTTDSFVDVQSHRVPHARHVLLLGGDRRSRTVAPRRVRTG